MFLVYRVGGATEMCVMNVSCAMTRQNSIYKASRYVSSLTSLRRNWNWFYKAISRVSSLTYGRRNTECIYDNNSRK